MNTAKHTPGPWRWMRGAERGYRLFAGAADGKQSLVMISGSRGGTLRDTPNEANAALIARAPDLLAENEMLRAQVQELREALELLLSAPQSGRVGENAISINTDFNSVDAARAALAPDGQGNYTAVERHTEIPRPQMITRRCVRINDDPEAA